ncbi:MAG: beta-ketoacyl synthase chain length factor, partial [Burkholderiales bacterium]|nr:beta-ketoacyl synthase chain length factor [Burkholderiales bacterium]
APALLGANERRRASAQVLMTIEVAARAAADAGRDAADLASVHASAHGDLAITDAICRTLAADPLQLSPTRFHHSVHNAPSGYWAIAARCHGASTALAAGGCSFGAGLLEAACQCAADAAPRLYVASDTAACGALASVNHSRGLLALALVLACERGPASRWTLDWRLRAGAARPAPLRSAAALILAGNAMADALPLFEALAAGAPATLECGAAPQATLDIALAPL